MEPSDEDNQLLGLFQAETQPKPRMSISRVEKGTHKVNTHQVQEKAAVLLATLVKNYENKNDDNRNHVANELAKEVQKIISDFGLDATRINTTAEKRAKEMSNDVARARDLAEMEAQYAALGAKLDAMKKGLQGDKEQAGTASPVGDVRNTRGGGSRKRDRDVLDVDACLENMKTISKRMKSDEDGRRRQS